MVNAFTADTLSQAKPQTIQMTQMVYPSASEQYYFQVNVTLRLNPSHLLKSIRILAMTEFI